MAVNLTWGVAAMECFARLAEYQNVVFKVSWTLTALNDETGATATTQGIQNVPIDPTAPFTPYADLTEAQVIGWVQTGLGTELVAQYEADVTNQVNPEFIAPPLPWAPPPAEEPVVEEVPVVSEPASEPALEVVTEAPVANVPTDTVAPTE